VHKSFTSKTRSEIIMLKKILILAVITGLYACANNKAKPVVIAPEQTINKQYMSVKAVEFNDQRKNKALAVINGKSLPLTKDLPATMKEWLTNSIEVNQYGTKVLTVNLLSFGSFIKQETMSFSMESVLEWQLKLESKKGSWTKSYQTTMTEEGPLSADNTIVERHLNQLTTVLLEQSLNDPEFNQAIFK